MRVRVLGQLAVTDDNGVVLGADDLPRRARQVLAVLAARHDRIQSKDALADAVWGTSLPGNHVAALEHYVSMIRRRLQPSGNASSWFIVTRSGGYLFDTGRASLDLADVRARIRALDAVAPDERLTHQEEILALAQELPFPEDPYADWAEDARNEVPCPRCWSWPGRRCPGIRPRRFAWRRRPSRWTHSWSPGIGRPCRRRSRWAARTTPSGCTSGASGCSTPSSACRRRRS
jgi:DNA-binding winged helix-turn-helix (wHTH) protein